MTMAALGLQKYKTLRFYETSLTEKDILQSFKDMTDLFADPKHYNAMQCFLSRSHKDFALGMSMSVCYSVRLGTLIRYGSVKAPTMLMVYKNCEAIDSFVPKTTFGVKSKCVDGFEANLLNDEDNKDKTFETKEEAEKFAATLNKQAVVESFKKETKIHKAPHLYSLSDLQVDCAKMGYSPDRTLEIAQSLYETHKILSYPRTSGTYLASGKAKDFPDMLNSIKDIPELKPFVLKITSADIARAASDPNIVNDKEVAKASHDALIPTGQHVDINKLSKDEAAVFIAVCKRFIAHFMPMFTETKTTLILNNNGNKFKANGRETVENGFNDVFGKTSKDEIIPEYNKGDVVKIDANVTYEKTSTPPARYTMGTIINAMKHIHNQVPVDNEDLRRILREGSGIGTEATRAGILKELKDTGYISVSKNAIYITELGKQYVEGIRVVKDDGSFDYGIADPLQVGYWSSQDKAVQNGEKTYEQVMERFEAYLNKKIAEVKASGDPIKRSRAEQASLGLPACPLCGGKVLSGKFGYYCSTYKESGCKLSIPNEMAGKKLTDNQKKGLLEGKKIHAKGFTSKAGKQFEADIVLNKSTGKVEFDFSSSQKSFPKKN